MVYSGEETSEVLPCKIKLNTPLSEISELEIEKVLVPEFNEMKDPAVGPLVI